MNTPPPKNTKDSFSRLIFLIMFLGGALGAGARYLIEVLLTATQSQELVALALVNLGGAMLLGFVNGHPFFGTLNKKLFFGHGLLGSFTTMSGLVAIGGGVDLGLSADGYWYWLYVFTQLIIGILVYAIGLELAKRVQK